MAKSLRIILDFLSYDAVAPANNPSDAMQFKRKVEDSTVSEVERYQKVIPASTSNLSLNLADTSTDYLIILVDQPVSIVVNGSNTPMALNPKAPGIKTPAYFNRGTITSLTISNAGSVAANIDYISVKL